MDLTLLTCIYNTPFLIDPFFKSFEKYNGDLNIKKLVINTSDDVFECEDILKRKRIPFHILCGATHGKAVNFAFNIIKTKYVLLVDSDILFYKNIKPIYDAFVSGNFTLLGKVEGDRGGKSLYPRVQPWFCFIDLEFIKKNNIQFFDEKRTKESKIKGDRIYDVGSTMYEDIINSENGLVGNAELENKYFKHYEGMSWRMQKYNPYDVDTDIDFGGTHPNKGLYEYGKMIYDQYLKDVQVVV